MKLSVHALVTIIRSEDRSEVCKENESIVFFGGFSLSNIVSNITSKRILRVPGRAKQRETHAVTNVNGTFCSGWSCIVSADENEVYTLSRECFFL